MKPVQSEILFVESLFRESIETGKVKDSQIQKVIPMTGDVSTRRYYRLHGDKDSYVVCLDNPLKKTEKFTFEVVQSFLKNEGVSVPNIYHVIAEKGYLLEEDLGNKTMIESLGAIDSKAEELDIYKRCIDIIISLQKIPLRKIEDLEFSNLKFDTKKLMEEVEFSIKHFLVDFLGADLKQSEVRMLEGGFYSLCQQLNQNNFYFTHRDLHSRNLMMKNNELVLIDFQDGRMGLPHYDLASLLDDAYYELERSTKYDLLRYYWDNIIKEIREEYDSFDHFRKVYDLMAIQRVFKALGTFGYIYGKREDTRYLKFIGRCFENLKNYLFKYPEFKNIRKVLSLYYYEH
jgi:hypothetical protein